MTNKLRWKHCNSRPLASNCNANSRLLKHTLQKNRVFSPTYSAFGVLIARGQLGNDCSIALAAWPRTPSTVRNARHSG